MTWTALEIDVLRRLWDAGKSASTIGREIGRTKNSVIGKVHREGLPSRPSPLIRKPSTAGTGYVHNLGSRRKGHLSIRELFMLSDVVPPQKVKTSFARRVSVIAPEGFKYKTTRNKCQWIEGEPTRYDSCKCEAPAVIYPTGRNSPYCEEHVRMVWRPAPPRKRR